MLWKVGRLARRSVFERPQRKCYGNRRNSRMFVQQAIIRGAQINSLGKVEFGKNIMTLTVFSFGEVFANSSTLSAISSRSSRTKVSLLSWRLLIALISNLRLLISSRMLRMSSVKRSRWWQLFVRFEALAWSSEISERSSAIELDSHSVNFSFFGDTPWRSILISALKRQRKKWRS